MTEIELFVRERNEALWTLDPQKIREWAKRWNIQMPTSGIRFWAVVYKAVCNINGTPPEVLAKAEKWLSSHNMSTSIKPEPPKEVGQDG